jgi:predicted 3-demethylubiquinone-9 3-methyltransferase (glyoxalase superfamily)
MQKIMTSLWFDGNAEEAVNFYVSLFKNSEIMGVGRYSEEGPGKPGTVMTMQFKLDGQEFMAINGGPVFQFTPAISMFVNCETQEEVDFLWEKLLEGGQAEQCGWLKDRFGLSWQIVPTLLGKLMSDSNPVKAAAVSKALLKMIKLDCRLLQKAYDEA